MEKPVSVFAAYRMVCESENKVPPVRKQIEKSRKFDMDGVKTNKNIEGYGGAATDLFSNMNYSGNPNRKYSDKKLTSPFCDDTSACNANSGVFSQDLATVEAALSKGVRTNHMVQSKLISLGFMEIGAFEDKSLDYGLVDALVWQCLLGNDLNVRAILKYGYKPLRKYNGLTPITAAILGKNLQCLKLVLAVPAIRKMVNDADGFGERPIQCAAKISGIDPFEFAREVVTAGGHDRDYKHGEYSALMLTLIRRGNGATWTPNLFAVIQPVSDAWYEAKDGETAHSLAEKIGNLDATRMMENFLKFGRESLNPAILDNGISF